MHSIDAEAAVILYKLAESALAFVFSAIMFHHLYVINKHLKIFHLNKTDDRYSQVQTQIPNRFLVPKKPGGKLKFIVTKKNPHKYPVDSTFVLKSQVLFLHNFRHMLLNIYIIPIPSKCFSFSSVLCTSVIKRRLYLILIVQTRNFVVVHDTHYNNIFGVQGVEIK